MPLERVYLQTLVVEMVRPLVLLILDLKGGAFFRPSSAFIIQPGRGNIGVAQPILHLGNIRPMI